MDKYHPGYFGKVRIAKRCFTDRGAASARRGASRARPWFPRVLGFLGFRAAMSGEDG